MFTTGHITIAEDTVHFLYLYYTPSQEGTYTNNLKIYFEKEVTTNNTTTWEQVGSTPITLQIKVTSSQSSGGSQSSNQQQQTTSTTSCLQPLRTKIYKVIYLNSSIDFSIDVINACDNVNLTLIDADIEGVPPQVAYIKDTELKTLKPGDIQTIKVHFDGSEITKPTTLDFSVIISGKYGSKFETATVDVVVNVISKDQISSPSPSSGNPQELNVDYTIQEGYLIVKGAYYLSNNTKIYLPNVPIEILHGGTKITYTGPIQVQPGETYCISASYQGFVPFFKCITAPELSLCVTLDPDGKEFQDKLYYPIGTSVKIESVYDCNTGDPIRRYKVFYAGKYLSSDYISVEDSSCNQLRVTAEGYKDWIKSICGYSKLYPASSFPSSIGNYSFSFKGTVLPGTVIKLVKITPAGEKVVGQYHSKEFLAEITEPGDYKIIIKTPIYEETYTFHVTSSSLPPLTSARVILLIVIVGAGAFLFMTLLMYYLVKKHRSTDMAKALEELNDKLKQLK